jgi:hypothetical protein
MKNSNILITIFALILSASVFSKEKVCEAEKQAFNDAKKACKSVEKSEKKQCRKDLKDNEKKTLKVCKKEARKTKRGNKGKKGSKNLVKKCKKAMDKLANNASNDEIDGAGFPECKDKADLKIIKKAVRCAKTLAKARKKNSKLKFTLKDVFSVKSGKCDRKKFKKGLLSGGAKKCNKILTKLDTSADFYLSTYKVDKKTFCDNPSKQNIKLLRAIKKCAKKNKGKGKTGAINDKAFIIIEKSKGNYKCVKNKKAKNIAARNSKKCGKLVDKLASVKNFKRFKNNPVKYKKYLQKINRKFEKKKCRFVATSELKKKQE